MRATIVFFFLSALVSLPAFSQLSQRSEVGAGLGTFNYTGDLTRTYNITQSKFAATVFYRANISKVISFRTSLTGGKIGATEKPIDAFAAKRAASFNLFLLEASTVFEYHFLNWRDDVRRLRFTPYLFAGMGLFGISGNQSKNAPYSNVQMAIPFGGGMKYVINPKYYLSFEVGIRKTFFDYLDNISDGNTQFKNYRYGSFTDTDNYFFTGLTLTYTFYDIPCPSNPYK
jgi:hypothetical protein